MPQTAMCGIFHFQTSICLATTLHIKVSKLGCKSINNHFSNPKRIKTYNIHACNRVVVLYLLSIVLVMHQTWKFSHSDFRFFFIVWSLSLEEEKEHNVWCLILARIKLMSGQIISKHWFKFNHFWQIWEVKSFNYFKVWKIWDLHHFWNPLFSHF